MRLISSSASAFKLDWSKILSFGKELTQHFQKYSLSGSLKVHFVRQRVTDCDNAGINMRQRQNHNNKGKDLLEQNLFLLDLIFPLYGNEPQDILT